MPTGERRGRAAARDDGQLLPLLAAMVVAFVAAGGLLLQVGLAADLRARAQTAADAAALAAAQSVREQLLDYDDPSGDRADHRLARARAEQFARRNGARVVDYWSGGHDVRVTVATEDALTTEAVPAGARDTRGRATARARVTLEPWDRGAGAVRSVPPAPPGGGGQVEAAYREADRIDKLGLPYLWGGGHQSSPAPADGPFDCSGAVSRVLQAAGFGNPTMVSGEFLAHGEARPCPEGITVWAYDGHVFMTIRGRGFGTSRANPGGGAGWLPYSAPSPRVHPQARPRCWLPDPNVDLDGWSLPDTYVPAFSGWSATVALVTDES